MFDDWLGQRSIAFLIFGLTNRRLAEDERTYQAKILMATPEVQGIDLFKIAGRSISGWIPASKRAP